MKVDAHEIYRKIKKGEIRYDEEKHCALIIKVMSDPDKGYHSAFCVEALVGERKFYEWLARHPLFQECYCMAKMFSRQNWEDEGRALKDELIMPGTSNHKMDHWRMVGWSRFGIGKNARIRLELNPDDTPDKHYQQLLKQAGNGDFTAGEIKQLMEAINVGLNTHEKIALQKEIDQLKADLATMNENTNADSTFSDKGFAKKD